jgi:hypothetical protein
VRYNITIVKHIPNYGRYNGNGEWVAYAIRITGLDSNEENILGFKTTREHVMEPIDQRWFQKDGSVSIEKRRFESSENSTFEFVDVYSRRSDGSLKLLAKKTYSDIPELNWKTNIE